MAIYHLHAKTGSRKNGQSAAAKSDYIQREGKYSRGHDEVLASGTGHMPAWAADDARLYWQAADVHERANGRLFKEIEFALPVELTLEQQQALVDEFAHHITGEESLPYSYAIHAGEGINPHCHLMVSERVNDGHARTPETWFKRAATGKKSPEDGGARKTDSLKPKAWLADTREAWADHANRALDRAGIAARVDHRSLTNQGIERVPQIHVGTMGAQMIREGRPEQSDRAMLNLEIKAANLELHQLQERAARRAAEREAQEQREWEEWTSQPGVCSATGHIVDESWMAHKLEQGYRESQRLVAAERATAEPEAPARQQPLEPPQATPAPPALTARERALVDARALFSVPDQLERAGIIRDAMIDSDEQYADAFQDALIELKIGHLGELPAASRQESEPQRDAWSQERQQEPPQRNAWGNGRQEDRDRSQDGPELG